jgi:hypothetical protein
MNTATKIYQTEAEIVADCLVLGSMQEVQRQLILLQERQITANKSQHEQTKPGKTT